MAFTITSVSPHNLHVNGGTTIRVVGTNLTTVTTVTFNGDSISGFTKTATQIEFPSPEITDAGLDQSFELVLGDGSTTENDISDYDVYANGKTYYYPNYIYPWHNGTVRTDTVGNDVPQGEQQRDIMDLRLYDGTKPELPLGWEGPEFP